MCLIKVSKSESEVQESVCEDVSYVSAQSQHYWIEYLHMGVCKGDFWVKSPNE